MLILILCSPSVFAHPGRTDSNGRHFDYSTGDYHYHHGYSAHAHFDMDGDSILDCPYDFDDQTNHSVGTVSSSGSYADGKKDGYTEGYSDGYEKGNLDGYDSGFEAGKADAKQEYQKQIKQLEDDKQSAIYNQRHIFTLAILFLFVCSIMVCRSILRKKEKTWAAEEKKRREKLEWTYKTEIAKRNSMHESRVKALTLQIKNLQRFTLLDRIANKEDTSIQLPDDVRLIQSYTPIKGNMSKNYPYGKYTVFMTHTGKIYHCKHDCVASAKPTHFFDLPSNAKPCTKCVRENMHPQPRPDWYIQIREKLDAEYSNISQEK